MLAVDVRTALRSFSLEMSIAVRSETLALVGQSGAGKTTLLRIVAGLLRPDSGEVRCDGATWFDSNRGIDLEPERRRCGYLFQDHALFPNLSVWKNVGYGLHELRRSERRSRVLELLDHFDVADLSEAMPSALSGGERQRVALARALAREPSVLLLDEPMSSLDATTRGSAQAALGKLLATAGCPAIMVTHDFNEAALLADRIAVVDKGVIVQDGTAADIAARPASTFVAQFAGASVLTGSARPTADGMTSVTLDGGPTVFSTDLASGPVAVSVFPWDVTLGAPANPVQNSAQNHVRGTIRSVAPLGNRVRVALDTPQPLTVEISSAAVLQLGIAPGLELTATWKATATRLSPL